MKELDLSRWLYDLVQQYPELRGIMADNGFAAINQPGMLQTAGRYMTIPKGAQMKKIPLATIINVLEEAGFLVKGVVK